MKKIITMLVVAALLITVFAGCGKNKDDASSDLDGPEISMSMPTDTSGAGWDEDIDPDASEPIEREYSIPEDAIDISHLFEEESSEDGTIGAAGDSIKAGEKGAVQKDVADKKAA